MVQVGAQLAQPSTRGTQCLSRSERGSSGRSHSTDHQQSLGTSLLSDPWKHLLIAFLPDTLLTAFLPTVLPSVPAGMCQGSSFT